jgi:hypothetical protein
MVDDLPPMTTSVLTEYVRRLWPVPVVREFFKSNQWFHCLTDYAGDQIAKPKGPKAYYEIMFEYDFMGFECVKDVWKVVFLIRDRITWSFVDGHGLVTPLKELSKLFKKDLLYMANVVAEKLVDIRPVREAYAYRKTSTGEEIVMPYWRLFDE